jgi:16S rRNA (adenine1518-N6/adenine1519-N6)-dimethyltransferase
MYTAVDFPPLNVASLLHKHGLAPRKRLGQNFLIDESFLQRIGQIADITPQDTVLEVGAGLGSLTRWLAQSAKQVVAVELDLNLIPLLKEVTGECENIKIVAGDILQLDPTRLMNESGYIVAANIPYFITSALFRHLLEAAVKPKRMVLTVQSEVSDRICAQAGELSLLALSVQVYGYPQSMMNIPAKAFYPTPKVSSTTLRVDLYPQPLIPQEHLDDFFRLIKAGFSQKRKMLHNSLSASLGWPRENVDLLLKNAGIDSQRRAQTLSMDEWRLLTKHYVFLNQK